MTYLCEFCKRAFAKESTWYNHSCEKKRRWMNRDTASGRLAFESWKRFHDLSGAKNFKKITQEDFIQSSFYGAFSKFAQHIIDIDAIAPRSFIDYVIKNNLAVDRWCNETIYLDYVRNLVATENSDQAVTRTVEYFAKWSQTSEYAWNKYFHQVNTNIGTMAICNGRISPWVLYNAESAVTFLTRCSPEQVSMIQTWAPAHVWSMKFKNNRTDADFVKTILLEAGV